MNDQLIFIYNANSDLFSIVTDFTHKILSPSTYQCHLCALTYGNFSVKQEWRYFIESLPVESLFLHKDKFEKQYKRQASLPAVYFSTGTLIKEMINSQQINHAQSLHELEKLITEKLKEHVQHHHPNI